MLKPTPFGVHEISQWLGLQMSMADLSSPITGIKGQIPHCPRPWQLDVAQPWLDGAG